MFDSTKAKIVASVHGALCAFTVGAALTREAGLSDLGLPSEEPLAGNAVGVPRDGANGVLLGIGVFSGLASATFGLLSQAAARREHSEVVGAE